MAQCHVPFFPVSLNLTQKYGVGELTLNLILIYLFCLLCIWVDLIFLEEMHPSFEGKTHGSVIEVVQDCRTYK